MVSTSKKTRKKVVHVFPFQSVITTALLLFTIALIVQLVFIFVIAPQFPDRYLVDNSEIYFPAGGLNGRETDSLIGIAWISLGIFATAFMLTIAGKKFGNKIASVVGLALLVALVPLIVANQIGDAINNLYNLAESLVTLFIWLILLVSSIMFFLKLEKREVSSPARTR